MPDFHCMFCGRARCAVRKLVCGPGVFICDACVSTCLHALEPSDEKDDSSELLIQPAGPETPATIREYRARTRSPADGCPLSCSFCGRRRDEVPVMIRGYLDCICEDCVCLCSDILAQELGGEWMLRQGSRPPPRL
jgi:ATP-dependent protease Clp ATPase subunit